MPWSIPVLITLLALALGFIGGSLPPAIPRHAGPVTLAATTGPETIAAEACRMLPGPRSDAGTSLPFLGSARLDARNLWSGLVLGSADSPGAAAWRAFVDRTKGRERPSPLAAPCGG